MCWWTSDFPVTNSFIEFTQNCHVLEGSKVTQNVLRIDAKSRCLQEIIFSLFLSAKINFVFAKRNIFNDVGITHDCF